MNHSEYETLLAVIPQISAADLTDQTPRLLLWGYDLERREFIVQLVNGRIERLSAGVVSSAETWEVSALSPSKRAYPELTDFDFAKQLTLRGVSIPFTTGEVIPWVRAQLADTAVEPAGPVDLRSLATRIERGETLPTKSTVVTSIEDLRSKLFLLAVRDMPTANKTFGEYSTYLYWPELERYGRFFVLEGPDGTGIAFVIAENLTDLDNEFERVSIEAVTVGGRTKAAFFMQAECFHAGGAAVFPELVDGFADEVRKAADLRDNMSGRISLQGLQGAPHYMEGALRSELGQAGGER